MGSIKSYIDSHALTYQASSEAVTNQAIRSEATTACLC